MTTSPTVIAVSLKAYFGCRQTIRWCERTAELLGGHPALLDGPPNVRLVVLPSTPLLPVARQVFRGTPVEVGAQDVSRHPPGAWTGEVTAALLAEVGCTVVEVGHAERRAMGEDDDLVAAKAAAAWRAGLAPLVCVGEIDQGPVGCAASQAVVQLTGALRGIPGFRSEGPGLLVAYEPRWAIGAERPAPEEHVNEVCRKVREHLRDRWTTGPFAVLYGGSAGPSTLSGLGSAVDGLFLGRRAHDPSALAEVVAEAAARAAHRHGRPSQGAPPRS